MRSMTIVSFSVLTLGLARPLAAQPAPCFWDGQLFTCHQPPQAPANADVFVARAVTGPASAFTPDFSSDGLKDYSRGVHDSMVNNSLGHLASDSISVSTEAIAVGSHRILKTRVFAPSQMFMYQFAGVSGSDRVVVGCISRTARPFEIKGTECERQATKAFGN
jgi:hypothetical protein